jgi:hypothetical protein
MSTRWAIKQAQMKMFHAYHHELENRADSGTTPVDNVYVRGNPFSSLFYMCIYMTVYSLSLIS